MAHRAFGWMKTNLKMPDYHPGSCNIGGIEVRRRKTAGYFGALLSLITFLFLILVGASDGAKIILFFPILLTVISWFQARRRFCLAFGLAGTFNFGAAADLTKVIDPADLRADRVRALKTILEALAYAGFATTLIIVLSG